MRVIAGKFKGRTLISPKDDARPTLDRMKESLFNILNFKLQNAVVLDLFAGSGQLAIESLSRGAKRATLCDNSRHAEAAIKANFLKIGEEPRFIFGDYIKCLDTLSDKFDVIFIDPPYKSGFYQTALCKIMENGLLSDDGWIVCEHSADSDLPQDICGLSVFDSRKIGAVKFEFYKRSTICA